MPAPVLITAHLVLFFYNSKPFIPHYYRQHCKFLAKKGEINLDLTTGSMQYYP